MAKSIKLMGNDYEPQVGRLPVNPLKAGEVIDEGKLDCLHEKMEKEAGQVFCRSCGFTVKDKLYAKLADGIYENMWAEEVNKKAKKVKKAMKKDAEVIHKAEDKVREKEHKVEIIPLSTADGVQKDTLPPEFHALSKRHQLFVLAYVKHGVARKAAREAGFKGTDSSVDSTASHLLKKPKIAQVLQKLYKPAIDALQINPVDILREVHKVAFRDDQEFLKVKHGRDGEVIFATVQLKDKLVALRHLSELMGMLKADNQAYVRPNLHLHWHEGITEEEARRKLIDFLRSQG